VTPVLAIRSYHLDAIGSVRAITDAAGATVTRHDYFAFGEDTAPMTGDPRRFTRQEIDSETGLHYFGARYYSSGSGRFRSPDVPLLDQNIHDSQSWNLYSYVRNNSLKICRSDREHP
jgi:RHS repeat-associated protein